MKSSQIIYPPYNIDSLLEKANEELDCLINEQRGTKEEQKEIYKYYKPSFLTDIS